MNSPKKQPAGDVPAGYVVTDSVWDDGEGGHGVSWMVFDPDGTRFHDDYGSRAAACKAARHHARTGQQLPA